MIEAFSSSLIKSKAARLQSFLMSQHSRMLLEVEAEEAFLAFLGAQLPVIKKLRDTFRGLQVSKQVATDSDLAQLASAWRNPDPLLTLQDAAQPPRVPALLKSLQLATPKTGASRPGAVPLLKLDAAKKRGELAEQPPASDGMRFERRRLFDKPSSKVSSFCSNLKQKAEALAPAAKPEAKHLGNFAASEGKLSFRASVNHLAELRDARLAVKSPKKFSGTPLAAPKPTPISSRAVLQPSKQASGDIRVANALDRQAAGSILKPEPLYGLDSEIKEEAELSDLRDARAHKQFGVYDSSRC